MTTSIFKTAARHIYKNKFYTSLNILGLAVGLTCAIMILYWVLDEFSYDQFHENLADLYRMEQDQDYAGEIYHVNVSQYPVAPALVEEIPEINNACRQAHWGRIELSHDDQKFRAYTVFVDTSFFQMFTFPLVSGDITSVLSNPYSIVISEELARSHFPDGNAMGSVVSANNSTDLTITGITAEIPHNSSLRMDALVPFNLLKEFGAYNEEWGSNSIFTYAQTVPGANMEEVNKKITRMINGHKGDSSCVYMMAPISRLHLHSHFGFGNDPGLILYVLIFAVIGVFVLLVACINFMNLATARSIQRAKEIGVRKVLGATRTMLSSQFLIEAMLTTLAALALALLLVNLLQTPFQMVTDKVLNYTVWLNGSFILGVVIITLLTGILSGVFPAVILAAMHPISVLKGGLGTGRGKSRLRQLLVIIQFALSAFLISATIVVSQQLHFMQSKNLGYNQENLILAPLQGEAHTHYSELKKALLQDSRVLGVTGTSQSPTDASSNSSGADWPGKEDDQEVLIGFLAVDFDFCKTMGIEIVEGRDFDVQYGMDSSTDSTANWLVNEKLLRAIGKEDVVDMDWDFLGVKGQIVGVMGDFHFKSLDTVIEPLAIFIDPQYLSIMQIRLAPGDLPETLAAIEAIWGEVVPGAPFEFQFVDDVLEQRYGLEKDMGILVGWFSGMALLIGCLGLFGLVTFSAHQRTREISIRKVLGASIQQVIRLLCSDFMVLVLVANALAIVPAVWVLNRWLNNYGYHIELGASPFLIALLVSLLITLLTVLGQTWKAATRNPGDILRYE